MYKKVTQLAFIALVFWLFWMAQFNGSSGARNIIVGYFIFLFLVCAACVAVVGHTTREQIKNSTVAYQDKWQMTVAKVYQAILITTFIWYGWHWTAALVGLSIVMLSFLQYAVKQRKAWYDANPLAP